MPASTTTDNPLSSGGRGARHLRLTPAQSERYIAAVESRAQEAQREAEDAADAAEVISRAAVTIQRYARGYIERTKEFKEHKLDVEEFTASELVGLLASCVLPLTDVGSDFGLKVMKMRWMSYLVRACSCLLGSWEKREALLWISDFLFTLAHH